jgi:phage-related holin
MRSALAARIISTFMIVIIIDLVDQVINQSLRMPLLRELR